MLRDASLSDSCTSVPYSFSSRKGQNKPKRSVKEEKKSKRIARGKKSQKRSGSEKNKARKIARGEKNSEKNKQERKKQSKKKRKGRKKNSEKKKRERGQKMRCLLMSGNSTPIRPTTARDPRTFRHYWNPNSEPPRTSRQ